jgi:hypothetical protein
VLDLESPITGLGKIVQSGWAAVAFRGNCFPSAFEVFRRQREAKPARRADEQELLAGRS